MIIYNKYIPSKGFKAMAIFPIIFVRGSEISETTLRHEKIHFKQQKEMLIIFFFVWYFLEWCIKSIIKGSSAYEYISFEIEANLFEHDTYYLENRKLFTWFKYI